jgi:hypothetical protein
MVFDTPKMHKTYMYVQYVFRFEMHVFAERRILSTKKLKSKSVKST